MDLHEQPNGSFEETLLPLHKTQPSPVAVLWFEALLEWMQQEVDPSSILLVEQESLVAIPEECLEYWPIFYDVLTLETYDPCHPILFIWQKEGDDARCLNLLRTVSQKLTPLQRSKFKFVYVGGCSSPTFCLHTSLCPDVIFNDIVRDTYQGRDVLRTTPDHDDFPRLICHRESKDSGLHCFQDPCIPHPQPLCNTQPLLVVGDGHHSGDLRTSVTMCDVEEDAYLNQQEAFELSMLISNAWDEDTPSPWGLFQSPSLRASVSAF